MRQQRPRPFALLVAICLLLWGAWETRFLMRYSDMHYVPYIFAGLAALCALRLAFLLICVIPRLLFKRWRAFRHNTRAGSARFATLKDIRKGGYLKRKGFLVGLKDNKPVYVNPEACMLLNAPTGSGKGVFYVIPWLMTNRESMFVVDTKCTLTPITAGYRQNAFGHEIAVIDLSGLHDGKIGNSVCINPMDALVKRWKDPKQHSKLMSTARGMAFQLLPVLANINTDPFWTNGQRHMLLFAMLYVVIMTVDTTYTNAWILLSDKDRLENALNMAATTTHLTGTFALLAKHILTKLHDGDPKHLESFREGAVQALEEFAPGTHVSYVTSRSDIDPADMKHKDMTVYLQIDPTDMAALGRVSGLIASYFIKEQMRVRSRKKVVFLCDEANNYRIDKLPSLITQTREWGLVFVIILQEFKQWGELYGQAAIETLISQSEYGIYLHPQHETARLLSEVFGEETVKSRSFNLGTSIFDDVTSSVSDAPRRLKTSDEARRTKEAFVIPRNDLAMLVEPVGYHEIHPLASKAGINPFFGKPFKGKIRLRLRS